MSNSNKNGNGNKPCATCQRVRNGLYLAKFRESTPRPKKLVSVHVNLGKEYAHRYIYYFAAMGPESKTYNSEDRAYGQYCNRGVQKLNDEGVATLILEPPGRYKVKGKAYPPHVHFLVSNKAGNAWIKKEFTVAIEERDRDRD